MYKKKLLMLSPVVFLKGISSVSINIYFISVFAWNLREYYVLINKDLTFGTIYFVVGHLLLKNDFCLLYTSLRLAFVTLLFGCLFALYPPFIIKGWTCFYAMISMA